MPPSTSAVRSADPATQGNTTTSPRPSLLYTPTHQLTTETFTQLMEELFPDNGVPGGRRGDVHDIWLFVYNAADEFPTIILATGFLEGTRVRLTFKQPHVYDRLGLDYDSEADTPLFERYRPEAKTWGEPLRPDIPELFAAEQQILYRRAGLTECPCVSHYTAIASRHLSRPGASIQNAEVDVGAFQSQKNDHVRRQSTSPSLPLTIGPRRSRIQQENVTLPANAPLISSSPDGPWVPLRRNDRRVHPSRAPAAVRARMGSDGQVVSNKRGQTIDTDETVDDLSCGAKRLKTNLHGAGDSYDNPIVLYDDKD
ncbi:hypothetical protein C8Q76DRAFT_791031 [Earliella scabrosa]|nr:hypothetical protein C8Q76DRAFT_791031 [Earliella scabrosa]